MRTSEEILEMLYLRQAGLTYAAIGKKFGVTRQRVHQLTGKITEGYRERIRQRAGNCCEVCGLPEDKHARGLTYHHKGSTVEGYNQPDNILFVCNPCHRKVHSQNCIVRGISLTRELDALLKAQARREQCSASAVIQRALRRYLATEGTLLIEDKTASTEAESWRRRKG